MRNAYLTEFVYCMRVGLGLHVLQQPPIHPSSDRVLAYVRRLVSQVT